MVFREIAAFDVVRAQMDWPWVAFAASGDVVAFASSSSSIATRRLDGPHDAVVDGPSFTLPSDLGLGAASGPRTGLTAFSVSAHQDDALVAVAGIANNAQIVVVVDPSGERKRARVDALLGDGHEVRAIAFDRTGRRLWLSAENATETVTALLDVASLDLVGAIRSAAFPRPALHELHLHPVDDAVLLLAACGEEGSFARVVGFAGDVVSAIPTTLDSGGIAAGFVGFSSDGARVHLVEADELRTHGWPTLHELSSVPLADDFISSFSGAVLGSDIFVDGEDAETRDDSVMLFDRAAIHGAVLPPPAPVGMWAGRLGPNAIITVQAKGDPVRARVLVRTMDGPTKAFGVKHLLS
jgi:hypothetical protein